MSWHYLLIAYAAVGVVVWIRHTLNLFSILGGKAPNEISPHRGCGRSEPATLHGNVASCGI